MYELISLEEKQLDFVGKIGKELSVPLPFSKPILLTECEVVGNTFGLMVEPAGVRVGTRLSMFRDPFNKYDKNSIVIKDGAGTRLGFVPMSKNEIIARLLEAGKCVYCVVTECVVGIDGDLELNVAIYMEA